MNIDQLRDKRESAYSAFLTARDEASKALGDVSYERLSCYASELWGRYAVLSELVLEAIGAKSSTDPAPVVSPELETVELAIAQEDARPVPAWGSRKVASWQWLYSVVTEFIGDAGNSTDYAAFVFDCRDYRGNRAANAETLNAGKLWALWTIAERERQRAAVANWRYSFVPVTVEITITGVAS